MKVFIEHSDRCTFGELSQVWDNGYVRIAYIKHSKPVQLSGHSNTHLIDFTCCLESELKAVALIKSV